MDSTPTYICNPQTQKPVRVGSRVYNRLVRAGIVNPDAYTEPLPTPRERGRPRKPRQDPSQFQFQLGDNPLEQKSHEPSTPQEAFGIGKGLGDRDLTDLANDLTYQEASQLENKPKPAEQPPPQEEQLDRTMMEQVARCAANSVRRDPQRFGNLSEKEVVAMLERMIVDELGCDSDDGKEP